MPVLLHLEEEERFQGELIMFLFASCKERFAAGKLVNTCFGTA